MTSASTAIRPERLTAEIPDGTVVFLIGMRINSVRRVRHWLPVFRAMPRMLRELANQPELGLLDARLHLSWRVVMVVK